MTDDLTNDDLETTARVLRMRGEPDLATELEENDDAAETFFRGVAFGQNIVRGKTFHVIDSPELVTLRARVAELEKNLNAALIMLEWCARKGRMAAPSLSDHVQKWVDELRRGNDAGHN